MVLAGNSVSQARTTRRVANAKPGITAIEAIEDDEQDSGSRVCPPRLFLLDCTTKIEIRIRQGDHAFNVGSPLSVFHVSMASRHAIDNQFVAARVVRHKVAPVSGMRLVRVLAAKTALLAERELYWT